MGSRIVMKTLLFPVKGRERKELDSEEELYFLSKYIGQLFFHKIGFSYDF
jgi:hypothetical protein